MVEEPNNQDDRLMLKPLDGWVKIQTDGKVVGMILLIHMNIDDQGAELQVFRPEYLGEA